MSTDVQFICNDVLEWAASYDGPKFHALLCDPPYHLVSSARGSTHGSVAAAKDIFARTKAGGFMGKDWDGDHYIAFRPETWAGLAEHLHPGAFGMAFASARGWHRLAVAIEDAGLIIHPSIFGWTYGQGNPKGTQVNVQCQKMRGVVRCQHGRAISNDAMLNMPYSKRLYWYKQEKIMAGYSYGFQAIKPALEPLITFVKPLTWNPFCVIMTEITFLLETLSCTHLSAGDAEGFTNHLHQRLKVAVGGSAHGNVDDWASLETVTIAGDPSASNLAGLTLRDFVAGPAPTPDAMRQLVKTLGIGVRDNLSARDTATSEQARDMLQSIAWLWSRCLDGLSKAANISTTETTTALTTDLRILKSYLRQTISDVTTQRPESNGLRSFAITAEILLRSAIIKLPLPNTTIATASVSVQLAEREIAQEENPKAGANTLNPLILFQKPYDDRPLDCIIAHGAGALWIDGGRIATSDSLNGGAYAQHGTPRDDGWGFQRGKAGQYQQPSGRWPANLVLCHHPDCVRVGTKQVKGDKRGADGGRLERRRPDQEDLYNAGWHYRSDVRSAVYGDADGLETVDIWECVDGCPVKTLGEQSGEGQSSAITRRRTTPHAGGHGKTMNTGWNGEMVEIGYGDTGTAARFFFQADWSYEIAEQLAITDPVLYCPKANARERDAGLEPGQENRHPTLKPIALTRWLARLLGPPARYAPRRLVVPFAGTCSEAIGAILSESWEEIVAIDFEANSLSIGEARCQWWQHKLQLSGISDPRAILTAFAKAQPKEETNPLQDSLFEI